MLKSSPHPKYSFERSFGRLAHVLMLSSVFVVIFTQHFFDNSDEACSRLCRITCGFSLIDEDKEKTLERKLNPNILFFYPIKKSCV